MKKLELSEQTRIEFDKYLKLGISIRKIHQILKSTGDLDCNYITLLHYYNRNYKN